MKIRKNFVSNSSSSSFIIGFKKMPRNVSEMHIALFGNDDTFSISAYGDAISSRDAAESVFNEIKNKKPLSRKKMLDIVKSGYFPTYPDTDGLDSEYRKLEDEYRKKYGKGYWECRDDKNQTKDQIALEKKIRKAYNTYLAKQEHIRDSYAKTYFNEHSLQFDGLKYIFEVEYSDNDGNFGSTMEHGPVFDKIPGIKISHH